MSANAKAALLARLEDLELRLKLLEARVRNAKQQATPKPREKPAPRRARRRCGGCTLELPKGPLGETCVWCGFRFDSVDLLVKRRRAGGR